MSPSVHECCIRWGCRKVYEVRSNSTVSSGINFRRLLYFISLYIAMYRGVAWLIITGSGLDDWIYWHFYYNYNQLWQLTVNGCLRLAPFLTGLRVSSLPLWRMNWTNTFITSGRTDLSHRLTVPLLFCFSMFIRWHGNMLTEPLPSNGLFRGYSLLRERMLGEPFSSNGLPLWLRYSGCQASCYNMKKYVCVCSSYIFIPLHLFRPNLAWW
jgi:hypothetical protein